MEVRTAACNRMVPDSAAGMAANLLFGILTGTITVITSASVATLIFTDPLAGHLAQGINAALITAVVVGLIVSLRSSCGIAIAIAQDRKAPILAIMASSIVAAAPAAPADELIFMVLAAIVSTTLATGAFLLTLGLSRAGGLMRLIPYSVLGCFFLPAPAGCWSSAAFA